jgi:hypothetical protein
LVGPLTTAFVLLNKVQMMVVLDALQREFSVVVQFCYQYLTLARRRCSMNADGGIRPTDAAKSTQTNKSLCVTFCTVYSVRNILESNTAMSSGKCRKVKEL